MKNRNIILGAILSALAWFEPLPAARAVVPPPDGGYPGFTTAEGNSALQNLTTGVGNTAAGWHSLFANTTGNLNTAIGAGTLLFNTGDNNTATGALALLSNTGGFYNTADGAFALLSNTSGSGNTASGYQALYANAEGNNNAAFGYVALSYNTFADFNTALGSQTLVYNTTGSQNTAVGYQALVFNTTGHFNTAVGYQALANSTNNVNTALGYSALGGNTTGAANTALGGFAGSSITTANNVICIGSNVNGANVSNSCYIGSIFGQTASGGTAVFINSDGKLGTATSSRRFKEGIKPMDKSSEAILALEPVTFRYKKEVDSVGIPQFGLVAEDVEKVNPDLVVRDKDGELSTVRYEAVNAMLLNEFLKEHQKVQALEKQVEKLTAGLQKVSDQLEASKPAPQVVENNQ